MTLEVQHDPHFLPAAVMFLLARCVRFRDRSQNLTDTIIAMLCSGTPRTEAPSSNKFILRIRRSVILMILMPKAVTLKDPTARPGSPRLFSW